LWDGIPVAMSRSSVGIHQCGATSFAASIKNSLTIKAAMIHDPVTERL